MSYRVNTENWFHIDYTWHEPSQWETTYYVHAFIRIVHLTNR